MRLYDILKNENDNGRIPYHMPGHKRNGSFDYLGDSAEIDFTEIDGLDNLHAPCGILLDVMERAAELYHAKKSFVLVNGSTGGILSAVYSVCRGGGELIAARSSHKSVYNAATLCGSTVHYIMPRIDSQEIVSDIKPSDAEAALKARPNASAMIITSPTYEGAVSDIAGIAAACHAHKVPLIVDAAHGAHLGFLDENVKSPTECGADIVVMSLHKTLPSLTQTGLLHVCGDFVDPDTVAQSLGIFESTSPSYIFMASVDGCLHEMTNQKLFEEWSDKIEKIRMTAEKLGGVSLAVPQNVYKFDKSKLILACDGYSGEEIAKILRDKFRIEPEMTAFGYALLMTGAGDTREMTEALCDALKYFSENRREKVYASLFNPYSIIPNCRLKLSDALNSKFETILLSDAENRISADYVMPYPPGIPIIAPGEVITSELIREIESLAECGLTILTSHGRFEGKVKAVV